MSPVNWQPIASPQALDGLLTEKRQRRLIVAFLLLGLVARLMRYVLCFPLWDDESFLCANFINRDFAEILQPLGFHQVAPSFFLWLELAFVRLFGYSELVLRLFPFCCSVASLFLFLHLVRRLLAGPAQVFAIAVFAVAYPCIRYAAEAKPYGSDLFVSLLLIVFAVEWLRRPEQNRWLWLLIGSLPFALGLSYPAVFIAGGISLFLAWHNITIGGRRRWLFWLGYNCVLMASFAGYYFLTVRPQSGAELNWMAEYWNNAFPPLTNPAEMPRWILVTHTSNLLAYPVGGDRGASVLNFLCVAVGVVFLLRRRSWSLLLLTTGPWGLHLLAAALQRYPYGVHVKYSQYLAPFICLLVGLGIAVLLSRLRRGFLQERALIAALGMMGIIGGVCILRDVCNPHKTLTDMRMRAFARWFWFNSEHDSETVCLKTDLGKDFSPATYRELSWAAMYLCNQHIYSPRHRCGEPPNLNGVSAKRPLRIVQFKDPRFRYDRAAFKDWFGKLKQEYRLISRERFAFPCYDKHERTLINACAIEVYKFVPRRLTQARLKPVPFLLSAKK